MSIHKKEPRVQKYQRRLKLLEDERDPVQQVAEDITDYILPRRGKYLNRGESARFEQRNSAIIDGTATRALRVLAAGMQGGLT